MDGGLAGWLAVLGSFVAHVQCLGTMYTFTLFILPYQRDFNLSAGAASVPGSLATGIMLASGPVVGRAVDRCGSRSTLFVLALVHITGMWVVSAAYSHSILLLGHVLAGFGMSVAPASIATVQQHFDKRRASATGVALAGSGAGQFVLSQLISARMHANGPEGSDSGASADWRAASQALCITALLLLLPATLLLRTRTTAATPPADTSKFNDEEARIQRNTLRSVGCDKSVLCVFGCVLAGSFGMYVPFVYLGPFLSSAQVGLSERDSAWLVSSLGLFNITGRVVLGVAADRIGRLRTLRLSLTIMLASTVAYPLCSSWLSSLLLIVVPYGTFSGSFIAMPPALIAMHVMPRLPEALGTLLGFNWLAMSIGSTFGPPLAGLFVDGTSFGWHAVMGCATVSLAAALFALWLTPSQHAREAARRDPHQETHAP